MFTLWCLPIFRRGAPARPVCQNPVAIEGRRRNPTTGQSGTRCDQALALKRGMQKLRQVFHFSFRGAPPPRVSPATLPGEGPWKLYCSSSPQPDPERRDGLRPVTAAGEGQGSGSSPQPVPAAWASAQRGNLPPGTGHTSPCSSPPFNSFLINLVKRCRAGWRLAGHPAS